LAAHGESRDDTTAGLWDQWGYTGLAGSYSEADMRRQGVKEPKCDSAAVLQSNDERKKRRQAAQPWQVQQPQGHEAVGEGDDEGRRALTCDPSCPHRIGHAQAMQQG